MHYILMDIATLKAQFYHDPESLGGGFGRCFMAAANDANKPIFVLNSQQVVDLRVRRCI
jgi:hypothetical protein